MTRVQPTHRPEIDGLRALAVLLVIFFHAGFAGFGGGFVGVDMFFVISGYLITSILLSQIRENKLRMSEFYERRARRILPALVVLMFVCIPFAWFGMLPDEMENFGQSIVATSFFANNILLTATTSYWDVVSEYKPLIHTWSLGVEGSYYLIFPVVILLLINFQQSIAFGLAIIIAFTLILANYLTELYPEAAFYLFPMRFWEFTLGGIAAILYLKDQRPQSVSLPTFIFQSVSLLGLSLVIASVIYFSSTSPHPGLITLVPTLGTTLIIWGSRSGTLVARLLSAKPFVWIGLVSYSLYLWHVPVFSVSRIYAQDDLGLSDYVALVIVSIVLSIISYHYIEKPFRSIKKVSSRLFYKLVIGCLVVLIAFGLLVDKTNGLPLRVFDTEEQFLVNTHENKVKPLDELLDSSPWLSGGVKVKVLLIGDSYAEDIAFMTHYLFGLENVSIKLNQEDTCFALDQIFRQMNTDLPDVIGVSFDEGHDLNCSLNLISVAESFGINVFFFGTKHFGNNLNWIGRIPFQARRSLCQRPNKEFSQIDFRDSQALPKRNYISVMDWVRSGPCVLITTPDGNLVSSDRKHLTIAGVKFLSEVGLRTSAYGLAIQEALSRRLAVQPVPATLAP